MHINCCVYIAHWGSKVKARGWKARRLGGEKPEIRGRKSEPQEQQESNKQMTDDSPKTQSAAGAFYEICGSGFHLEPLH